MDTLPHYHIRWYGKAVLDWERFSTHEDATARAKLLAQPGENYAIEEYDKACPRCHGNHETEVRAPRFQKSQRVDIAWTAYRRDR